MKSTLEKFGKNLLFNEEEHKYFYTFSNGETKEMTSATTVFKEFFPFDAKSIINQNVFKWLSKSKLCEFLYDLKPFDINRIFAWSNNPKSPYFGKTPNEIEKMWQDKAQFGTDVHLVFENYLNGDFVSIENDRQIKAFNYAQRMEFDEVLSEVRIVAPTWGIAGTIDALVKMKGKWYIVDWKTDKTIRTEAFGKSYCPGLLSDFQNCNYNKFCFQLGLYRLILDIFYDIDIHGMMVVHIPEFGPAKEYKLPYHVNHIGLVVKKHKSGKLIKK